MLRRTILLFLWAMLCMARTDPVWKLGTVVDSSSLRDTSALDVPVYAPSGAPVADVPGVQMMAIQAWQLVIIGENTAYIIDRPGQTPPAAKRGLHFKSKRECTLSPRRQILYHHEKNSLYVLDDSGGICKLPIVAQQALRPEK